MSYGEIRLAWMLRYDSINFVRNVCVLVMGINEILTFVFNLVVYVSGFLVLKYFGQAFIIQTWGGYQPLQSIKCSILTFLNNFRWNNIKIVTNSYSEFWKEIYKIKGFLDKFNCIIHCIVHGSLWLYFGFLLSNFATILVTSGFILVMSRKFTSYWRERMRNQSSNL